MSILHLQHARADGEIDTYHLKSGRRYHIGRGSTAEVRILDMKMSRQHCAIEFRDGGWDLIDLGSTNGIRLDGKQVDGRARLLPGATLEAGGTSMTVGGIDGDLADNLALDLDPGTIGALEPVKRQESQVFEAEQLDGEPDEAPLPMARRNDDYDPEPASESLNKTAPLTLPHPARIDLEDEATDTDPFGSAPIEATPAVPAKPATSDLRQPERTASGRIKPITIRVGTGPIPVPEPKPAAKPVAMPAAMPEPKPAPTVTPAPSVTPAPAPVLAPAPAPAAAADSGPALYLTLLGQRIGPLTRQQARELKTRELKGQLSEADLAPFRSV